MQQSNAQQPVSNPQRTVGASVALQETTQTHLGRTGIFVEVNGKYYLLEQWLKEFQERISSRRL